MLSVRIVKTSTGANLFCVREGAPEHVERHDSLAAAAAGADAWIREHQLPGQMVLVKIGQRTVSVSSDQRVTSATLRALLGLDR